MAAAAVASAAARNIVKERLDPSLIESRSWTKFPLSQEGKGTV